MSVESGMSPSFYDAPKACPQNSGGHGAVEAYDELLRSACSLIEILDEVGCTQRNSEGGGTAPPEIPQSGCGVVTCETFPRSETNVPRSADICVSNRKGLFCRLAGFEPFWLCRLPGVTTEIAFAVLCMIAVASASIAGFSIVLAGRNINPTTPRVQSDTTSRTEVMTLSPEDPFNESIPLVAQSPLTVLTETAPHLDTGQPNEGKPREDLEPEYAATTGVPTGTMSAALPLRAHADKRLKSSASRQYAEWRRRVRQKTAVRYSRPVYYGAAPRSYYSSFDRGYSYGGPAPHSDTGG